MKIIHVHSCSSTQDIALNFVKSGVCDVLIMADVQTAGRGRLNERTWLSSFGNFHGSFIIDIRKIPENATSILNSLCLNIVRDFIISIKKDALVTIKNPNDIMIDGKKIAGVLIEIVYPYAVIGIGVNTKVSPLVTSTNIVDEFREIFSNTELGHFIYNRLISEIPQ